MSTPPPAPPPAEPLPSGLKPLTKNDPPRLGPYRIVGRIGAGGMGAVYGGLDPDGQCVAVKTVHATFARKRSYREAFAREVDMLSRARGISTAHLHAADTQARVPWLAFDYVPGRDLRRHVREFGPLQGDMLRAFAAGTAEGLAALHTTGIAHRDIKPGNVILSPDGPKIVDFGIATTIGARRATDRGASYGTPGWVAPERYAGAGAAAGADIFAWAGLVTLAATGRDPFGKGTPEELRRRVCSGEYDVEGVPEPLLALVKDALAIDPQDRPSAVELLRALLPAPSEVGLQGRGRSVPAAQTLRALLGEYWRGVDDAGHDPGTWAAAVGMVSAAGLAGGALGSAAAGAGSATGTATGATGTATGATGTATGAGSAGVGTGSGGAFSALAGSKAMMAGAGALVTVTAATGGYIIYDQFDGAAAEAITSAAQVLEEGEGFVAEVDYRYTDAHAEEVAAQDGLPVDEVLEASVGSAEYHYSAAEDLFLLEGEMMGEGTAAAARDADGLYVYGATSAPRDEWSPSSLDEDSAAEAMGPELVTGPLRDLVEADDLDRDRDAESQDGGRVYSGASTSRLVVDGEAVEETVTGRVELDPDGQPVGMEYTGSVWEVELDLVSVDTPVELSDPVADEDLRVLQGPVCGQVEKGNYDWHVIVQAWDITCEEAMEVSQRLAADDVEHNLMYVGTGMQTYFIDQEYACEQATPHVPAGEERRLYLDGCREAELVGQFPDTDFNEYETSPYFVIRFVEVE